MGGARPTSERSSATHAYTSPKPRLGQGMVPQRDGRHLGTTSTWFHSGLECYKRSTSVACIFPEELAVKEVSPGRATRARKRRGKFAHDPVLMYGHSTHGGSAALHHSPHCEWSRIVSAMQLEHAELRSIRQKWRTCWR